MHKILFVVGPTRAGEGVIARVLGRLVGTENVAGPTLSSLYRDQWTGKLPARLCRVGIVDGQRLYGPMEQRGPTPNAAIPSTR